MNLLKPALISTAILLASGMAYAEQHHRKLDLNNDQIITYSEFAQRAELKFQKIDADNNGFISEEERKAAHKARKAERRAKKFEKTDLNNDGALTPQEVEAKAKMREEKKAAQRDAKKELRKEARKDKRGLKERFKMDLDDDGMISRQEFDTKTQAMFAKLDSDQDGVLSETEMSFKHRRHFGRKH